MVSFIVLLAVIELVMSSLPAARPGQDTLLSHYCDFFMVCKAGAIAAHFNSRLLEEETLQIQISLWDSPSHVMVPRHALKMLLCLGLTDRAGKHRQPFSHWLSRFWTVWCLFFIHRFIDQSQLHLSSYNRVFRITVYIFIVCQKEGQK